MAKSAGRSYLLKVDVSGTYTTVGGLKNTSISIGNELVDVTNKDSAGVRELLAAAGTQTFSISGAGTLDDDDTGYATVHTSALNQTALNYKLIDSEGNYYLGSFLVASVEKTGEFNGAVQYSISLENSGSVAYTSV